MEPEFASEDFLSCSFAGGGGGGRYFSAPSLNRANRRGGFGSQTAADAPPPCNPRKTPEQRTVGTVTVLHTCLPCKHVRVLSMPALQAEAAWAEERFLGDLRQPVPQTAASIYTL